MWKLFGKSQTFSSLAVELQEPQGQECAGEILIWFPNLQSDRSAPPSGKSHIVSDLSQLFSAIAAVLVL